MDSASVNTKLRNSSSGESLDVVLEYSDNSTSNIKNSNLQFRILFINAQTDKIERHIDYDFVILDKQKEIYRFSNQTGQSLYPLHSSNGIAFIPIFTEFQKGEYEARVIINGISFNPILPEHVQFHITYG